MAQVNNIMRFAFGVPAVFACCLQLGSIALAQQFPVKPVHIIVGFPPGGSVDLVARYLSQKLTENLGEPLLVENRPGANTNIAAEYVARSPADGYTLLHTLDSTLTINQALYQKIPFDPIKDFAGVSRIVMGNSILAVDPKVPARTLKELFEYAKANPGKLNYAATAASTQLTAEQIKAVTGINIVHVPYKGGAQLIPAIMNGEIDFLLDGVTLYVPYIKTGKLRGLATFASRPDILVPEVPTTRDAGFPQMERDSWWGWFAPAATPREVVARLNAAVAWALSQPDLKDRILGIGLRPISSTPEELDAEVRRDIAKLTPLIRAAGLRAD